jgi:nucleolar complex protein 2
VLVEKLEGNSKFIEDKREVIDFSPQKRDKVDRFLQGEDPMTTPLGGHLRLQKKLRDAKRVLMEKAVSRIAIPSSSHLVANPSLSLQAQGDDE